MEATLKQVMTVMVQFVVASIRSLIGRENSQPIICKTNNYGHVPILVLIYLVLVFKAL